ncbi:MAG: Ltp family lipoprotein [bacterium]|nr:Ltp family lipoprotein [bacterium]
MKKSRIISLALCLAVFMLMSMEGKAELLASLPQSYSDALARAKYYCDNNHMSKKLIYEQLISADRFPDDAARYAINNLVADYKANAVAITQIYDSKYVLSKKVLLSKLILVEKFTEDEANYAINYLKIDFTAKALKAAQYYSSILHLSKKRLYEKLLTEYFTDFEARRAVENIKRDEYKRNALEKARFYRSAGISKEHIFDMLVSDVRDAFTFAEAQYASANL